MAILELACPNCSLHAMKQNPSLPFELVCQSCGRAYAIIETSPNDSREPVNPKSQLLRE